MLVWSRLSSAEFLENIINLCEYKKLFSIKYHDKLFTGILSKCIYIWKLIIKILNK